MADISKDELLRTAELARLSVSDVEAQKYTEQLNEILTFTEKINDINTDGVEATTNGNQNKNVLRNDEPIRWTKREEALNNAPEHEEGQFKVPAIMD